MKDYNGDMQRPPDIARSLLRMSKETRFWKDKQTINGNEVQVGNQLVYNLSGEAPGKPAVCTDIWIVTGPVEVEVKAKKAKK